MNRYEQHKEFFSQPIRLCEEDKQDPAAVITSFFIDIHLYEVREHLSALLETALTTDNDEYAEPAKRAALLSFLQKLEEMAEAAWLLHARKKSNNRKIG